MLVRPARLGYLAALLCCLWPPCASAQRVDFNRDVRPILSDNCFHCHGPDESARKARLRLDQRDGVLGKLRSGGFAVVPGDRNRSELFQRIHAEDGAGRMPPRNTGKTLTLAQIELLGKWIDEGAHWNEHWAWTPPQRPPLPEVADQGWPRNAIDLFVLQRLQRENLRPAPEADRVTLLRRLSFDLTGLPPTPAEVDAFVADRRPDAYEKVVERLLSSPHYGERMAQQWLDLARYADTNGYRLDNHRDLWPWRDWVIQAFNRNLPFDQFTVEQLAGDLLPGATIEQKIATGFHRNTMVNFGNGSDPKEYRHKAVADRVTTTATVWLGITLGCAQCHEHKYDPFTQKDFYRLYAFFNNVPEKGLDGERANPVPSLLLPTPEQAARLAVIRKDLARVEERLREEWPRVEQTQLASAGVVRSSGDESPGERKTSEKSLQPERLVQHLDARARARLEPLLREQERLKKTEADLLTTIPATMVMEELATPRVTRVLLRGDYLSEGEVVTAGVPACLPPLPQIGNRSANRLDLARWLVAPENPLTARVVVNRCWETFFGAGLVRTSDDFGAQGEPPSHSELLDWLATELVARQWDLKALQRLIVMSATYRQSSHLDRALAAADPHNRLLARGPRLRLDAEVIRDNALAVSGLLDRRIGGRSVYPYQPTGLWEEVTVGGAYSSQTYTPSKGRDLYRRGLYTYWKRSMPPPALSTFDAPNREACTVTRPRTNTPLQALVLMNDPTFVEAARALGQRVLREEADDAGRLAYAFKLCTGREPRPAEMRILARVFDQQLRHYRADRTAARALVRIGESARPDDGDVGRGGVTPPLLAAWTALANLLLNLDETITRE